MENNGNLDGESTEMEGDRLIFKVLNSGDFFSESRSTALTDKRQSRKVTKSIFRKKALRY